MKLERWALPGLVGLGLALRLGLAIASGLDEAPRAGSDQQEYDTYAWNVAQGRGYRGMSADVADQDHLTAYRSPGTSLVWAVLYAAFGHRYDVVRITYCLLGAASILLVYGVGARAFDRPVGLMAAAAFAVLPTSLQYSTELLSEPLACPLFLAYVLACLRFAARPNWRHATLAGLLLGCGLLVRPNFVLMLPLAVIWSLWVFRRDRRALALSLLIPAISAAVLIPWTVRNYRIFGAVIPFSTMGGSVLLQGNNRVVLTDPNWRGYAVWDTLIPEYRDALRSANDELERDRRARTFAVRWLKDNPDKWWTLVRAKLYRAWTPLLQPHSPRLYRVGMLVSWGPVLALFLIAAPPTLVMFLRARNPGLIIHLAILSFVLNTIIFFGLSRYRYPIEGLCLILAAWAVRRGFARIGRAAGPPRGGMTEGSRRLRP